jgi:hypothetical protein
MTHVYLKCCFVLVTPLVSPVEVGAAVPTSRQVRASTACTEHLAHCHRYTVVITFRYHGCHSRVTLDAVLRFGLVVLAKSEYVQGMHLLTPKCIAEDRYHLLHLRLLEGPCCA